uniref:CHCH domain-containing protein n=1 Tax=Steinernema glaseri TaxID=37863 RepID=A0A1I8A9N2_9BILA
MIDFKNVQRSASFHITRRTQAAVPFSAPIRLFKSTPRRTGPENADGSVNWTCPCLAHGSMVAHRCGFFFRPFYLCAKKADSKEVHRICANEFVNWNACLKRLNDTQREKMREAFLGTIKKEEEKS